MGKKVGAGGVFGTGFKGMQGLGAGDVKFDTRCEKSLCDPRDWRSIPPQIAFKLPNCLQQFFTIATTKLKGLINRLTKTALPKLRDHLTGSLK